MVALAQTNIQSVNLDFICVGERMRPSDDEAVFVLAADIEARGLLSPIAVRETANGMYRLIYGHHRLLAWRHLANKSEGYIEIPAIVWSSRVPDWQIQLAEISENLCRKELTPAERTAHTLRAAAIYKRQGLVVTSQQIASESGKRGGRGNTAQRVGTSCPNPLSKPTIAEKLSSELGIARKTAQRRLRGAALDAGMDVTLETATPEELEQLAECARKQTKNKPPKIEKAKKKITSSMLDDLIVNFRRADEALLLAFIKADRQDDTLAKMKISNAFRHAKSERSKILKSHIYAGYGAWGHLSRTSGELQQDTEKDPMIHVKNRADEIIRMAEEKAKKL